MGISAAYNICSIYFLWSLIALWYLRKYRFDIVHAHKLTTEGIFGYIISIYLKAKLVLSIRGGSDCKNIERLRDLKLLYRRIYKKSAFVFWVSPWAREDIDRQLNYSNQNSCFLPNICKIKTFTKPESIERKRYCTVVSLHQMDRKGLIPLLNALKILVDQNIKIYLDIYGSGTADLQIKLINEISRLGLNNYVNYSGEVSHEKMMECLNESKGLILPAKNETFGMAYIEALSSTLR